MSEEGLLGFGMGIMVADLQVCGYIPVSCIWLKISKSLVFRRDGKFLSIGYDTLSAPGLFPFALAIEDSTSSSVKFVSTHVADVDKESGR